MIYYVIFYDICKIMCVSCAKKTVLLYFFLKMMYGIKNVY